MTIIQYETLRNRIDGILGNSSPATLKFKRLVNVMDDLLIRFGLADKSAYDLYQEASMEIDNL